MSDVDSIRRRLVELGRRRADVERKTAAARDKQSQKSEEAARLRARADNASSDSISRSHRRSADAAEKVALAEGGKAAKFGKEIADIATKESALNKSLNDALKRYDAAQEQLRQRGEWTRRRAERVAVQSNRQHTAGLISASEDRMTEAIRELRPPEAAPLRILFLTAASKGDLRVDEEMRRVKAAVQSATHRDLIQIEHKPAATADDLMDGLLRFKPHVVHFSGHADEAVLVFDDGSDRRSSGHRVTADAFSKALGSVDEPPTLVVLNACNSRAQLQGLLTSVPLAVGMSDSIRDIDAMTFAARFYSAVAEGQSVQGALHVATAQMALNGLPDADLPVLVHDPTLAPESIRLVVPPR